MKKRKNERMNAKKVLDNLFSKYIRLSHADQNGYCTCITCGKKLPWKEIQNGHYIQRGRMGTRYDQKNCGPQCWGCNGKHLGNGRKDKHALYIMDKYGAEELRRLDAAANTITKLTARDLLEMIVFYKEELVKLGYGGEL